MEPLTPPQKAQIKKMMTEGVKPGSSETNPNYYMSFDPGEGSGWATFAENGKLTDFGNVYADVIGMTDLLFGEPGEAIRARGVPKVIIYEQWRLMKTKNEFFGDIFKSSQVVGVIRAYARICGAEAHAQERSINPIAQSWTGLKPVGNHNKSHWVLAVNHGWYHLQKNKIVIPRISWPSEKVAEL
jgi:hypothetical protein